MTTATEYSAPVEMTVSGLQVGDFITEIPTQSGYRGVKVNSAITSIREDHDRWSMNHRRGGRRFHITSYQLAFASVAGYNLPADWTVIVRRPAGAPGVSQPQRSRPGNQTGRTLSGRHTARRHHR